MVGEKVGNYRITGQLGEGGMGIVYTGEHELLANRVAIKVIHPELSRDPDIVQRFFNEAKAATKVQHPSVVKIHDYGYAQNGSAYFAMEYLDGELLAARIRRRRIFPTHEVAQLGRQMAGALAAAHAAGIIHRDLKPDNVFVVPDPEVSGGERVKILDFGIAKLASNQQASVKTRTGSVMGTPYYMSPEQCRGAGEVDHRSDIYAVGCILFELAAGRPPFVGEGIGEVLAAQQLLPPPPPRTVNAGIPIELEGVILRSLAKRPDERQQTMGQLAEELEPFLLDMRTPGGRRSSATPIPVPKTAVGTLPTALPGSLPPQGDAGAGKKPKTMVFVAIGGGLVAAGVAVALVLSQGQTQGGGGGTKDPIVSKDVDAGRKDVAGGGKADAGAGGVVVVRKDAPDAGTKVVEPPKAAGNPWVKVDPPLEGEKILLGLKVVPRDLPREQVQNYMGFRPGLNITAPAEAFELQQHEVTWAEMEAWIAGGADRAFPRPAYVPADAAARAKMPVTGVPWDVADRYCRDLGGGARLPKEEEWEFAARGSALRKYPWGDSPDVDPDKTTIWRTLGKKPREVMTSEQDKTPGANPIYDLLGNAQEWTDDFFRQNVSADDAFARDPRAQMRAVRGWPVHQAPPLERQDGAAYRRPLCSMGACLAAAAKTLEFVGFRCARPAPK